MENKEKCPSARSADRIFDAHNLGGDNDLLRTNFSEYFNGLEASGDEPFDCPYLRSLSQSVGIVFTNRPSVFYEKGSLICSGRNTSGTYRRCQLGDRGKEAGVTYDPKSGLLEMSCDVSGIKISAKPVRASDD